MEEINKILTFIGGSGYGSGDGSGSGYGYGYGSGDGSGSLIRIKSLNGDLVFYVDGVPTIFDHIHNNIAIGRMVNEDDFSTEQCYIAKLKNCFAHERTAKEAVASARSKYLANLDTAARIAEFCAVFNAKSRYKGKKFFEWHNILTGSCQMGRQNFMRTHNYSMEDRYTVAEFIKACENDFGGEIIKQLKEFYPTNKRSKK